MQETQAPSGEMMREFFKAPSDMEVVGRMDARLSELEDKGHTLVRRVLKIGRNQLCPYGSGRKFKKCCIGLTINKGGAE